MLKNCISILWLLVSGCLRGILQDLPLGSQGKGISRKEIDMDHYYKEITGFQVDERVWVKGFSGSWFGKILKIHTAGTMANVMNVDPASPYYMGVSTVWIDSLGKA